MVIYNSGTVASQQDSPGFNSRPGCLSVEFACSLHVCMSFHLVLWLHPNANRYECECTWLFFSLCHLISAQCQLGYTCLRMNTNRCLILYFRPRIEFEPRWNSKQLLWLWTVAKLLARNNVAVFTNNEDTGEGMLLIFYFKSFYCGVEKLKRK